jgi:HEAT repeat protein
VSEPRALSDISMPRRPSGVSHAEGDDHDALALLESNGYGTSTAELLKTLRDPLGIFQAAAARTLGARGERDAADALRRLAADGTSEETARVQAAWALVRLGDDGGRQTLAELLALNPEASPAPLQAAGALARLGDPAGFAIVRHALESDNRITAMVATKQLFAFAGLHGVDLDEAYARALARPEENIVGEARAQLAGLPGGKAD